MKDKCSSWENGSKEVISFVRSRLLAAFQDLETITNKVEVHGIILRAVLGTRFFSLERIEMGLTRNHVAGLMHGLAASLRHCLACSFILHMQMMSTVPCMIIPLHF